jgi:hypothetical protein
MRLTVQADHPRREAQARAHDREDRAHAADAVGGDYHTRTKAARECH